MGGCSATLGVIGIGTTLCSGFSLAGDGANTYVNASSAGEVDILSGENAPLVTFNAIAATFHGPVYMSDTLTAANGLFQVSNSGDVSVAGNLSVEGQKNFQIDDPLSPADKYLYHSSVESSEMMNIYTGNVSTDAQGNATVQLPRWFQALNRDFRYQLTVIGQFAQVIVANEIENNQFSIKTDKPNVKVSWQVPGVRQDAYAKAHPLVVEQDKPVGERGYYLHPELFGQPATKGINSAQRLPVRDKQLESAKAEQTGD